MNPFPANVPFLYHLTFSESVEMKHWPELGLHYYPVLYASLPMSVIFPVKCFDPLAISGK